MEYQVYDRNGLFVMGDAIDYIAAFAIAGPKDRSLTEPGRSLFDDCSMSSC